MTTKWPYDADKRDPLTKLRIAVVDTSHPQWHYIVAFDLDSFAEVKHRPTSHEALLLQSFLQEYIAYWYSPTWKDRLAERPFDIDGGANGYIFRKWGPDDWGYRQRSWREGPLFWPGPARWRATLNSDLPAARTYSLKALLDQIHSHGDVQPHERWLKWKSSHPDLFGGTS